MEATSSSSWASSKIDGGGLGQDAGVGRVRGLLLDAEVGEEEVVVDDDDVGLERLAAHRRDEAALPVGAGLAEAGFGARVQLVPQRGGLGQGVDLGAVAGLGGLLPRGDVVELLDLFEAVEKWVVAQRVELVAAEIVAAALHVADLQRAEQRLEEGDVLEEELLLQIFCAGGDDDALLVLARLAQRGQKIGERLSGAGSGFDDEVALVVEGLFDGSRHLVLALAVLEGEGGAGEDSAGREEVVQRRQMLSGFERRGQNRDGSGQGQGEEAAKSAAGFYNRQVVLRRWLSGDFGVISLPEGAGESWNLPWRETIRRDLERSIGRPAPDPKKGRAPKTAPTTGAVDPRKRKQLAAKKALAEKLKRVPKKSPEREARVTLRGDARRPPTSVRPARATRSDGRRR